MVVESDKVRGYGKTKRFECVKKGVKDDTRRMNLHMEDIC